MRTKSWTPTGVRIGARNVLERREGRHPGALARVRPAGPQVRQGVGARLRRVDQALGVRRPGRRLARPLYSCPEGRRRAQGARRGGPRRGRRVDRLPPGDRARLGPRRGEGGRGVARERTGRPARAAAGRPRGPGGPQGREPGPEAGARQGRGGVGRPKRRRPGAGPGLADGGGEGAGRRRP